MIRAIAILTLLPCVLIAQDMIEPWRAIASLTRDWSGDGLKERVVLAEVENPDSFPTLDLFIYREDPEQFGFIEIVRIPDIAWQGRMWGTHATMEITDAGSIQITSGNEAIGRGRWHEILTIAYRDETFRLAGFYNDWYDTLELDDSGTCDLNLLNGEAEVIVNGGEMQKLSHSIPPLPLELWSLMEVREFCAEVRSDALGE